MNQKVSKFMIISFILLPLLMLPEVEAQTDWNIMTIQPNKRILPQDIELQGISGVLKKDMSKQDPKIDVFAVGSEQNNNTGIILYYDGNLNNEWVEIIPDETLNSLNDVQRGAEGDFYAVGDKGTVFHGKGKQWENILHNEDYGNLKGVWVSSKKTIFVVGNIENSANKENTGIVIKSTDKGKSWSLTKVVAKKLEAIWGSSENTVFVVGEDGAVFCSHDGGITWESLTSSTIGTTKLHSIWCASEQELFVVGEKGKSFFSKNRGKNWEQMDNPDAENHNLNGIWGRTRNDIYAVGDGGTVLYYSGQNGLKWEKQQKPLDKNLNAVWVSQNPHIFVVGMFIANKTYPAIWGYICNACSSGVGIANAEIWRLNVAGQWELMGDARTGSDGSFDYTQQRWQLSSGANNLKFKHSSYSEETKLNFYVPQTYWLGIYAYLMPTSNYQRCVSGVVTELDTSTGRSLYKVMNGITVHLYTKGCDWSPVDSTVTSNGGHFYFNLAGKPDGLYKVFVDDTATHTFSPEHQFYIPQDQTTIQSYDIIGD